ncbi:glycosyltransferase family A protein [Candidatus Pelagibacter sp.]|uniref:glycosyltransferase family A protein n=1 Tax=Candidatus Pelagibacter sp. TaxID=2024849 RepID=UPI003F860F2A
MNKDLVTVVITSYNKKKFIKRSIQSALNQTYKTKEVIVFDDKSSDGSTNIIKNIKNIKFFINKKKINKSNPLNQLSAILKCIKKSRGKYIFLLDGDDYFKKKKIEHFLRYFSENHNINVIQDKPFITEEKKILHLKKKNHFFSIWPSIYPTSTIAIRKHFFIEFINFIERNKYPNLEIDSRLVMYANLKNKLKVLNKSYTFYNTDPKGISSKYKKFSKLWWKKRNEAFDYLQYLYRKLGKKFYKGFDYFITKFIMLFVGR